ncbi:MAG: transaldolase [Deltaproteobacteria bacterium]|jgi:transaldolase|nr:transaldolase [Deltaproteobacteria bacterium]
MSNLAELNEKGQSIWFDFIRRSIITSGELKNLVDQGVKGVTSNPAIFEKAIAGSSDYDENLKQLIKSDKTVEEIYEALAFKDITMATDVLRPVYDSTHAIDGYVSLEVSPHLADDTEQTISEAKRLFETINRPNLMIKVPATPAGIPAITELIGSGVNVNVTLIFGLENYKSVAKAYIEGLEKLAQNGPTVEGGHGIDKVASVASFFVSRVDTSVDKTLAEMGNTDLQGTIAIANAKVAYAEFKDIFSGPRWQQLTDKGAMVQRVLWASTGTKNPDYSDTLYVDELIGPDTVNTLPPATLDSFIDHGKVAETLNAGLDEARRQLAAIADLGIDIEAVTHQLQVDGVVAFAKPFDALMKSIAEKREKLLAA